LLEVITTYFSWCLDTMTIAPEAEFLQQPKYPTSTILSIIFSWITVMIVIF
jgi:hypothetical protein